MHTGIDMNSARWRVFLPTLSRWNKPLWRGVRSHRLDTRYIYVRVAGHRSLRTLAMPLLPVCGEGIYTGGGRHATMEGVPVPTASLDGSGNNGRRLVACPG